MLTNCCYACNVRHAFNTREGHRKTFVFEWLSLLRACTAKVTTCITNILFSIIPSKSERNIKLLCLNYVTYSMSERLRKIHCLFLLQTQPEGFYKGQMQINHWKRFKNVAQFSHLDNGTTNISLNKRRRFKADLSTRAGEIAWLLLRSTWILHLST